MKRDIIIKGKTEAGEWKEFYLLNAETANIQVDSKNIFRESLGEYIHKTDKNGTKIFEGDIVTYRNKNYLITWDDDCACWIMQSYTLCWGFDDLIDGMTVVGNIFDNPELLEPELLKILDY